LNWVPKSRSSDSPDELACFVEEVRLLFHASSQMRLKAASTFPKLFITGLHFCHPALSGEVVQEPAVPQGIKPRSIAFQSFLASFKSAAIDGHSVSSAERDSWQSVQTMTGPVDAEGIAWQWIPHR